MGNGLGEQVRLEFLRGFEAESTRRLNIAQRHYTQWLESQGIKDPEAEVAVHSHLGYVGIVGQGSSRQHKRAYDILPTELLIEINREVDGWSQTNGAATHYTTRTR